MEGKGILSIKSQTHPIGVAPGIIGSCKKDEEAFAVATRISIWISGCVISMSVIFLFS